MLEKESPMQFFKVALLQMTAAGYDQAANQAKGEAFCRRAKAQGADLALFPEMWNIGYTFFKPGQPEERERWLAQAVGLESAFVAHFRALAQELNMAIALTYLEGWAGRPRNTVTVIDRRGQLALIYAKVHTCEFDVEAALTPGEAFPVAALDTAQGEVKIGCMICFDREFPESARLLMLQGAEIILTPNACTMEANRLAQFRTRAFENMVGLALANYAAPQNNGHSIALDAVAYGDDEATRDLLIVEAGEQEGVFLAEFDLERLRAYRAHEAWGNAYRRPRCYAGLTAPEVLPPFIRPNATR
jgi:predicted amidohydrolase